MVGPTFCQQTSQLLLVMLYRESLAHRASIKAVRLARYSHTQGTTRRQLALSWIIWDLEFRIGTGFGPYSILRLRRVLGRRTFRRSQSLMIVLLTNDMADASRELAYWQIAKRGRTLARSENKCRCSLEPFLKLNMPESTFSS